MDQQLELKTGDEIEQLAEAFNKMAVNLRISFEQIEQRMEDIAPSRSPLPRLDRAFAEMIYQLNKAVVRACE